MKDDLKTLAPQSVAQGIIPAHATRLFKLSAMALVVALAACGGGGGGGGDDEGSSGGNSGGGTVNPPTIPDTPDASTESALVTTVPAPSYAASSPEAAAFARLNAERAHCGFGKVAQSTKIDAAARDATAYWQARAAESVDAANAYTHIQDSGKSGFTGVTPADRVAFRGYQFANAGESHSTIAIPLSANTAEKAVEVADANTRGLLTTVYHLRAMVAGWKAVGIAHGQAQFPDTMGGYANHRTTFDFAVPFGQQPQGKDGLRTYPCQGTTTAYNEFVPASESPNPAPALGNASLGTPIFVNSPIGTTLTVSSGLVREKGAVSVISLLQINAANDVQKRLGANDVFLIPMRKLTAGTEHEVSVEGTIDGVAFTRTFTFTPAGE